MWVANKRVLFCTGKNIKTMEAAVATPINITTTALTELEMLYLNRQTTADDYLRVGVKGGGCSGMSYILGFDNWQDGDVQFEIGRINCVINKNHLLYLQGLEIDWHNGLDARGFIFNNPNAASSCGCGSSFSV